MSRNGSDSRLTGGFELHREQRRAPVPRQRAWNAIVYDFAVSSQLVGDVTVVRVQGEIAVASAPTFRTELIEWIAHGERYLVIDLTAVTFMDSSALGVLVGVLKRVRGDDGWVRLLCTEERILKMFRITGLTKMFPIYDTIEAALHDVG